MRCGLAAVLLLVAASASALPTAAAVESQIEREGGRAVLAQIANDRALADHVWKSIARGSAPWLRVAVALKPVADADAAKALNNAVAEALPRSPQRVLPLLAQGAFAANDACLPSLPDDLPPPQALKTVRRLEVALASVNAPEYETAKEKCLAVAAETRAAFEKRVPEKSGKRN